ncbi:myb-related transcription factor, partner of profilin-like isoform X1 [Rhincodon typus]|uniref:myb-related transcription factor, partner of profilin-like isoform X1 n=1 Tax=Rhincodon typus TaxID=259920 RepID=UPI00202EAE3F|nr:myb-related transcription factor, partner of profilin-like isoform X1 [Rhincodon typus]
MREGRTPRFSDGAVAVLLERVRAHREILFPWEGRSVPRELVHQAWMDVAVCVNARSEVPKTWLQCRKKFNGLTWTAKEKLARRARKRTSAGERPPSILDLTHVEQEALDIIGPNSRRSIENGEAGGQVSQGLSHYLGFTGHEIEGHHLMEEAPSPAPSFQYHSTEIGMSDRREGELQESSRGELFGNSEQELNILERTVQETDSHRANSVPSYTEEDKDADLSGPAFKRMIFHEHHQLLKALDSLPRSCLTLSESMEESASILCGVVAQGITSLKSTMEHMVSSVEAAVRPPVPEPVTPALASLIEAQTGAIQALACTISSGLEMLGARIDRGFSRVTGLLESALPPASGGANEARAQGSGMMGMARSHTTQDAIAPAPLLHPRPPTAPEAAAVLQPEVRSPRARSVRDRRP